LDGIVIRRARPEDREGVLSYCVNTFDWGDYIDEVYDTWLGSPASLLLVAEVGGKPVGIIHARPMSHGVAWLEGLRVEPSHRRSGVGRALTEKAADILAESGHRTLRLLVESNNGASMALALDQGFKEEATWVFYHGKRPVAMAARGPRRIALASASKVWNHLETDDLFNRACRSYEQDWALHPLEEDDFVELVRRRMVAISGEGRALAVAVVQDGSKERREAKACFLLGDTAETKELAAFVMNECAKAGARRLRVSSPNHAGTVEGLKARGFRPGSGTSIVYVRRA
jgi:ribosomal protein S18 acetylase RimI-like enzyme